MLDAAKAPVILMGGGVILAEAEKELVELAELLQIPVITTYMAKGRPARGPSAQCRPCGYPGRPADRQPGDASTVTLSSASAAASPTAHTGRAGCLSRRPQVHPYRHRTHPAEPGVTPDLGIVSDAKLAIEALLAGARRRGMKPVSDRAKELPALKAPAAPQDRL